MEKAYALKDAREKERQEYVQQCYNNRWRDACDDARTLDSQAMTLYMDQQRQEQIQERIRRKQSITAEEKSFLQYLSRYQDEQDEIERRKQEERSGASKDRSGAILEQVYYIILNYSVCLRYSVL